jgi:hypothetical protein
MRWFPVYLAFTAEVSDPSAEALVEGVLEDEVPDTFLGDDVTALVTGREVAPTRIPPGLAHFGGAAVIL